MKGINGRLLRMLLAGTAALLAVGVEVRQQAACQGCQPGDFTYDNPVGCNFDCKVIFSGRLTGRCDTNCEASVLQGWCEGTKGNCSFHRDWKTISCFNPPENTPVPTDTPLPTQTPAPTSTPQPSPIPTDTPEPTPIPTDTPVPTPTFTSTPEPTSTPLPPEIKGDVLCSVPGEGGWCRGGASLHLAASDPQGMKVVIHGDLNGSAFDCGASCALNLPEGEGKANFTAVSGSGRTASGSASWKLDSAPPELGAHLEGGAAGKNGWYTAGPVHLACTASDATSGVASIEYRLDGGAWGSARSAASDGTHSLECRARDTAGNASQAGSQASIDSGSPSTHIALADGVWLAGHTTFRGRTEDAVSGLADVQVALDGGSSWTSLGGGGDWSYGWDTRSVVDGGHTFSARGEDNAGNLESPQVVSVRVDNTPPVVSLAASWRLGAGGKFAAEDPGSGIGSVRVVFSGNGIQPRALAFSAPPAEITWDGIDGSGAHVGYGTYLASVTVCDLLGNCASSQGQVLNPAPPPPKPTWPRPTRTPTGTPTTTPTPIRTPSPSPRPAASNTPASRPPVGASLPALAPPIPVQVEAPPAWAIWPFIGLLGLVVGVGSTLVFDPRASGWRAMRTHIRTLIESRPGAETDPGKGGRNEHA